MKEERERGKKVGENTWDKYMALKLTPNNVCAHQIQIKMLGC